MSTYHVGVDVTRSIYVYVDADNEKEAEDLALIEAEADSSLGAGAWVDSKVHFIYEEEFDTEEMQSNVDKMESAGFL